MSRITSNTSWVRSEATPANGRWFADRRDGLWNYFVAWLALPRESRPQWPAVARADLFDRARTAMRCGQLDRAKLLLESESHAADAALLNLLGVIHEAQGNWRQARKHYGKSIRTDGKFAPARQNMRRWYELFTFGRTEYPILLGDEPLPSALEHFLTHPSQNMTPF